MDQEDRGSNLQISGKWTTSVPLSHGRGNSKYQESFIWFVWLLVSLQATDAASISCDMLAVICISYSCDKTILFMSIKNELITMLLSRGTSAT